jgi:glycerophosphoryl diester phosphodiesterase
LNNVHKKIVAITLLITQLIASLFVSGIPAYAAETLPNEETVEACMVDKSPIINGDLKDSAWTLDNDIAVSAEEVPQHAKYGILWDYTYLYVGVDIENDTELVDGSAWDSGDIVSLLFDPTKHKSSPYDSSDWQFGVGYNSSDAFNPYILMGGGMQNTQNQRDAMQRNLMAATKKTSDGWSVEMAIPWENLGVDPYLQQDFGFDVAVDNMIKSGEHKGLHSAIWCNADGSASFWNNTSAFGCLNLSDTVVENDDDDIIYQQDFDDLEDGPLPEGFTPPEGQESGWSVQDGKLVGDFGYGEGQRRIALPALGDNFTYQTDMSFHSYANTGRWTSAFYRGSQDNGTSYYHFTNRFNGAGEISGLAGSKWISAVNTAGSGESASLTKDVPCHLEINAFGQLLSHKRTGDTDDITFDHQADAYDHYKAGELLERGRFGLQIDQANVAYDNILIERLNVTDITVDGINESAEQLDDINPVVTADFSNGLETPIDLRDAKLYSSNPEVIRINDDGSMKALKTGTSKIAVIYGNKLFEQDVEVTPTERTPEITELTPEKSFYSVVNGGSLNLSDVNMAAKNEIGDTQNLTGDDSQISWDSSDEDIASVSEGKINAKSLGVAAVTAHAGRATSSPVVIWVKESDADNTYLSENFESGSMPEAWQKLKGNAEVVDDGSGNKSLQLQPYTRVLIPMPNGVGDYTIDADVSYTEAANTARWASVMYRVQNQNYPYFQFAVRQNTAAPNGTEFAMLTESGCWDVRRKASFSGGSMDPGVVRHMQITVTGDRVRQTLDGEQMEFTDLAGDYLSGDIGLQTDNLTARFDNIKVQLNPEMLPEVPAEDRQFAAPKILNENLVNGPTVTYDHPQSLSQIQSLISDNTTSSLLLDLKLEDSKLAVYSGSKRIGSLDEVKDCALGKLIMMFSLPDTAAADAFAQYIQQNKLEDINVVSSNEDVLKEFRDHATTSRATLLINQKTIDRNDVGDWTGKANIGKCKSVILSQSAATKDVVEQFQRRMMAVWVTTDDSVAGMHRAITSGANGILTQNPEQLAQQAAVYDSKTLTRRSFIIGHRGNPDTAPENTYPSYSNAYDKYGAQMIENDVYYTKDKQLVIFHDTYLTRTTDILTNTEIPDSVFTDGLTRWNCKISDLTLEQIKKLDAGSHDAGAYHYDSSDYVGTRIPTLEEQLQYIKGKDVVLFLELKDATNGIAQDAVDLIHKYNLENQVDFINFTAANITAMQEAMPTMSVAYLGGITKPSAEHPRVAIRDVLNGLQPMNAAYNADYSFYENDDFIAAATARGLLLWGWTYRDKDSYAHAIDQGLAGLTTDYANWAKDYAFTLEPEQTSYQLNIGSSAALQAAEITNHKADSRSCTPEVVVVDGGSCIRVDGNSIQGVKNGVATVLLRTPTTMDQNTYEIYTQPITVTVGTGEHHSNPSHHSTPSHHANHNTTIPSNPTSNDHGNRPVIKTKTGSYVTDTTMDVNVSHSYTAKLTSNSGHAPNIVVGTAGVFRVQLTTTNGKDYYAKLISVGRPGQKAGVYLDGVKLFVAAVKSGNTERTVVKSDTTHPFTIRPKASYVMKLTADTKPSLIAGTPNQVKIQFVKTVGKDHFFKITPVNAAGSSGLYVNRDKTPVTIVSVAR